MNWSKYSLKVLLTTIWNVGGPFFTQNGITIQRKPPQPIIKVVLYLFLRVIMNRLHTMLQCLGIHKKIVKDKDFLWLPFAFS
jgi:hypothetical protein